MSVTEPTLGELLAWLDRHINLEAIERGAAGRAAAPTLERISALMAAMGDPQDTYPIVHVTGTNGKGSTTRLCAGLLRAAGLRVGTITSPHLESLNERIATDDGPISDAHLAETLAALEPLEHFVVQHSRIDPPTWFELVTAAGYRFFADSAVDAAVVEVGLGGRYDATNVGDGAVAVVTNVELDHVEILGPTRAHIAAEKAGIIKEGAIAVIGVEDDDIAEIFVAEAETVGAAGVWRRGREFSCAANRMAVGGRVLDITTPGASYEELFLPLHGAHQGDNASAALAAAEAFFGSPLSEEVVTEAFADAKVPGRLEVVGRHPLVVLDGAHNAAGAGALGAALAEDFAGAASVRIVMGCLRGRDPAELLEAIGSERVVEVVACAPASPRAQPASAVAEAAARIGYPTRLVDDVAEAVEGAIGRAGPDDLVLVTGSLYVVGAARTALRALGSKRP